jgi:hypothetical protein
VVERNPRHAELLAQHLGEHGLRDEAALDQQGAELATVRPLERKDLLQLLGRQNTSIDQELSQPEAGRMHVVFRVYPQTAQMASM